MTALATIRLAAAADAEAIAEIHNAVIREGLQTFNSRERLLSEVADDIATGRVFVATDEVGTVQGFASYCQFRKGVGYAHSAEHTIYLHPDTQGAGLGRRLMTALCDHAAGQGFHVMVAGISAANPAGVAFHSRLGFEKVGQMREVGRKAGQWLDLVLMQKTLS